MGLGIAFRADTHNPAECVVKCAVILKTDFHGNFGQRCAFAHQKRGGIDAFFIDIELERAARDALERAGEIGGVVIGDPAQGLETQVLTNMEVDVVDQLAHQVVLPGQGRTAAVEAQEIVLQVGQHLVENSQLEDHFSVFQRAVLKGVDQVDILVDIQ